MINDSAKIKKVLFMVPSTQETLEWHSNRSDAPGSMHQGEWKHSAFREPTVVIVNPLIKLYATFVFQPCNYNADSW